MRRASCVVSMPSVIPRGILPALIPFVASSTGYVYSHLHLDHEANVRAALKMMPVIFLAAFCLVSGHRESKYRYFVAAGLIASSVGDYYLVWHDEENFLKGMGAFALAHLLYISAFGFESISPLPLVLFVGLGTNVIQFLNPYLKGVLAYGVPCYIVLISAMLWRGFARLRPCFSWTEGVGAFGALMFAVSDLNLALNLFYFATPYQGHHLVTMFTYFVGQLCIALSAVHCDEMARTAPTNFEESQK